MVLTTGMPFVVFPARVSFMMLTSGVTFVVFPRVTIIVAVSIMPVLGIITGPSVVAASMAMIVEAMFAPAVTIAPAGPGTHAQEDAVVEVIRPVKALGRASVRPSFVVAPLANGWFADFNRNLRVSLWRWRHYGQARK
jgi:hypothetical protein